MAQFLTLKPVAEILNLIRAFPLLHAEDVPLVEAHGRSLAEDFHAPEDLPGFNRSTMDGYAVRARDTFGASEGTPALLHLLGECPMGERPTIRLAPGETARIWTGGMLPEGADAVVMLEYTRSAGADQVEATRPVAPGDHIILRDEDARKGMILIAAGKVLRPQEIGILSALGQMQVRVFRKPRVAIISSGDEVLPIEANPGPGQVRDVNSYTLAAHALAQGAEIVRLGLVSDSREALSAMVSKALMTADVVLLSGGSSAGQRDFTLNVLSALPGCEILAHGVAISPGKPLIMARLGDTSLWGLPGHVASALVCAEVFIRPLLRHLLGQADEAQASFSPTRIRVEMARAVASAQGRRDYIRVALDSPVIPGGLHRARPIMGKSGLISTLVMAEALVICPEELEGLSQDQIAEAILLS